MKTKDFIKMLLMAFLSVAGLTACTEEEETWEPMKWNTEVKMEKKHTISVPAEGGTYQFTCTNYSSFWLSNVCEDGEYVKPGFYDAERLVGKWSCTEVKENVMTVVISPNETGNQRSAVINITAGDIFDKFTFNQACQ